jgi:hypothetical protein
MSSTFVDDGKNPPATAGFLFTGFKFQAASASSPVENFRLMLKYAFGESGSVGRAEKPNAKAVAISMPLAS